MIEGRYAEMNGLLNVKGCPIFTEIAGKTNP
jgi:hypothetical protein